jgi:hypothetical protein
VAAKLRTVIGNLERSPARAGLRYRGDPAAGRADQDGEATRGDIVLPGEHALHGSGRRIAAFGRSWNTARKAIGGPGLLLHDIRRSFARRMTLRGVGQKAVTMLGGWESPEVFSRHNIVAPADLEDGSLKCR